MLLDSPKALTLTKGELQDLADRLLLDDPDAIEACIVFIEVDTMGNWHGRARAMMCRRLKHCTLSPSQRDRLVDCITERLRSGNFSQQFRDLLRLALYLDKQTTLNIAATCLGDRRNYVRRYAEWILNHQDG
jgi:hypothetical protein